MEERARAFVCEVVTGAPGCVGTARSVAAFEDLAGVSFAEQRVLGDAQQELAGAADGAVRE